MFSLHTKKTTFLIVGTLVILVTLFWMGRKNGSVAPIASLIPPAQESQLSLSETSFDFGTISMMRGKVSHPFVVQNKGTEPLTIQKMYTSCMCTTAYFEQSEKEYGPFGMPGHGFVPPLQKTIAPNETVRVNVVFDPAAHGPAGVGPISRVVYLETAQGTNVELGIQAVVTP